MYQKKKLLSILIVEDEISIRKKLVEYVKLSYQNVYEAASEDEAYRIYKEHKLDLLILDINLQYGDGLKLLRRIRQKDHQIKAIVISAYDDKKHFQEAVDLKLTKYIVKPIVRKEFNEALNSVEKELEMFDIQSNEFILLDQEYKWDLNKNELLYQNEIVKLGSKEKQLLKLFCNNINNELSYDTIANELWDYEPTDKTNSIKIVIKKLRKNLPKDIIVNIYGIGYKLSLL